MKIDHISISRESVWKTCEQQYKYKYHTQIKVDEPTPIYFTFGKIVHKIIEEYTKARGVRDINDITKAVMSGELELEPGQKAPSLTLEYRNKLAKHISNFLSISKKIGLDGETEWPFYVDIDAPNKRHVKGFIDRIIINNGEAFLIDYKTTKVSPWRKNHKTITKDLQLQCYCWIVWKHFGIKPSNIKAALLYLEDAKLVPAKFCEETLVSVPNHLLKIYKQIEATHEDQAMGNVGDHCRRCDFRKICPFWKLT